MKQEIAQKLGLIAEELGIESVEVRNDYSAKGMFGKTTFAVIYEKQIDLLKLVFHLGSNENFLKDVENFRFDSFGKSHLVY